MKRSFLILLQLLCITLFLSADEEKLSCALLTVGPGRELYTWFGHTGIIIENEKGRGKFYDFGNFSFESDDFYWDFGMGRLNYLKIGVSSRAYLNYIVREDRDVTLQRLDIPQEKIRQMRDSLEEGIRPGNNIYLYHHYMDNCSTRPRDILNEAVNGTLKEATDTPTGTSFRNSFRRYSSHAFFTDWLLSFLQGRTIDRDVTVWETMFLPDELMKHVDMLNVNGRPLVLQKRILSEASAGRRIPDMPPQNVLSALMTGLLAGAVLLLLQAIRFRQDVRGRRTAAVLFMTIMVVLSLTGLLLWFISFFTDHQVARENINILVIHPFYLVAGILLVKNREKALTVFWRIQGGLWLLMTIFNLTLFHQGNLRTTLVFAVLLLLQLIKPQKLQFHLTAAG